MQSYFLFMFQPPYRNRHFNTPGHAHELTSSCYCQKPYLNDSRVCKILMEEIESARRLYDFDLWAYVIMPNHVHLLLWPKKRQYDIAEIQQAIKGRTARRYSEWQLENDCSRYETYKVKERGEMRFRFWQRGGGFDRNLWNNKPIYDSILYIENNPVRRGLAAKAGEWEWSSGYEGDKNSYIRPEVCRGSVPVMMKR
jgi:putative transposase